jgi:hypothetical protein
MQESKKPPLRNNVYNHPFRNCSYMVNFNRYNVGINYI